MKTKNIAILCAVAVMTCGCFVGCDSSTDSSETVENNSSTETSEETEVAEEISSEESENTVVAEDAEYAVEFIGTTLSTDYNGDDVLVVEYNFTNNSSES